MEGEGGREEGKEGEEAGRGKGNQGREGRESKQSCSISGNLWFVCASQLVTYCTLWF